ncbi:TniQ family protein [Mycobacteroides abscessus]|uniref:TniQ family protein n=1 Tax=Mycobacteroides abscessus TaxID=36809 RepID=UPI0026AD4BF8
MSARTLPIRTDPIGGEAIDSWLEAAAHRTHTSFGDLLTAVGLNPFSGVGTPTWVVCLNPSDAATIGAATGVGADVLTTMTLQHYSDRALCIKSEDRSLSRAFPWGPGRGSRFCPGCLDDAGGRWQLRWRLGWTFACTTHNCLLADACPDCGAVQRVRTHIGETIPQPGRCSRPARDATGRTPRRCGTFLTAAAAPSFDADHPVIHAQKVVNAVIDSETVAFGAYETCPQPRLKVLSDLRAVAGRVLAYASIEDLKDVVPHDLHRLYRKVGESPGSRAGPAQTETSLGWLHRHGRRRPLSEW